MLTLEPLCTADERSVLRAFRRVARDVDRIYRPLAHHTLTLDLRDPGSPQLDSFPEDPFRSLVMAVRQVYMRREATHFSKVCAILARSTDPEVREYIEVLKNNWHFALVSPMGLSDGDKAYGGREVFETWMYTRGLHWDPRRQPDAEILDKMDALLLPTHVVQCVTRGLAVCILQLDFAVADALGESPLAETEQLAATEWRFAFKIADPAT